MIASFLFNKVALPLLDWSSAALQAIAHVMRGTLCTVPSWNTASETE